MTPRRLLDIGGTFVKCDDGRMVPIPSGGTREEIAKALREAAGPAEGLRELAVAIPGPFDYRTGLFLMKHKFAAVYGENFRDLAGLPPETETRFVHDVVAVVLGSLRQYPGNLAVVTLGTGLGFCCAQDGKVLTNEAGSPSTPLYNRPYGDGILEDVVSARGIQNAYHRKTGLTATSKTIAERAYAGEEAALEVYLNLGEVLAGALQPMLEEYRIETLLFGGQISKSYSLFERPLLNGLAGLETLF